VLIAGLISLPLAAGAIAEEKHRQLGAHEHGHGSFNIAIEGKSVSMELEAPGADIVGFEHKARTKKQKAAVSAAKEKLKSLAKVIDLSDAAGCTLDKVSVELKIEGGKDDEHDHAEKKKSKHEHDHGHENEEAKSDEKEASHSEFHAEYSLTCSSPDKLTTLSFPYFKNFKGAEELEVSVVGPKSQKKYEVERDSAEINLGGVI